MEGGNGMGGEDSIAANKMLTLRITDEIWNQGKLDLIDAVIAHDFIDHIRIEGLEGTGRERFRRSVEMMRAAFSDRHESIDFLVAERDLVMGYVTITGTHDGELLGIPPTGKRITTQAMGVFRFVDGRVVERWGFGDMLGMMTQLGLMT
jgi:steroid delta-isomerase-like uncharacterized protein